MFCILIIVRIHKQFKAPNVYATNYISTLLTTLQNSDLNERIIEINLN